MAIQQLVQNCLWLTWLKEKYLFWGKNERVLKLTCGCSVTQTNPIDALSSEAQKAERAVDLSIHQDLRYES